MPRALTLATTVVGLLGGHVTTRAPRHAGLGAYYLETEGIGFQIKVTRVR